MSSIPHGFRWLSVLYKRTWPDILRTALIKLTTIISKVFIVYGNKINTYKILFSWKYIDDFFEKKKKNVKVKELRHERFT